MSLLAAGVHRVFIARIKLLVLEEGGRKEGRGPVPATTGEGGGGALK